MVASSVIYQKIVRNTYGEPIAKPAQILAGFILMVANQKQGKEDIFKISQEYTFKLLI